MSDPALAPGLSPHAARILSQLMQSGQSEDAGVADILNTIALNDADSVSDEFLRTCAQEIIEAAHTFLHATAEPQIIHCITCASCAPTPLPGG